MDVGRQLLGLATLPHVLRTNRTAVLLVHILAFSVPRLHLIGEVVIRAHVGLEAALVVTTKVSRILLNLGLKVIAAACVRGEVGHGWAGAIARHEGIASWLKLGHKLGDLCVHRWSSTITTRQK